MDKATKRPWKLEIEQHHYFDQLTGEKIQGFPTHKIIDADGLFVLIQVESFLRKDTLANAELIVKAVNEYDTLKAKEALFGEMVEFLKYVPELAYRDSVEGWAKLHKLLEQAKELSK